MTFLVLGGEFHLKNFSKVFLRKCPLMESTPGNEKKLSLFLDLFHSCRVFLLEIELINFFSSFFNDFDRITVQGQITYPAASTCNYQICCSFEIVVLFLFFDNDEKTIISGTSSSLFVLFAEDSSKNTTTTFSSFFFSFFLLFWLKIHLSSDGGGDHPLKWKR